MRSRLRLAAAIVTLAASPYVANRASALGMSPMYMELSAGGSGSSTQFQVSNASTASAAVEIKIETLSYDEAGNRRVAPAGGNLLVVPPVAAVAPGSTQTFRVQWVGGPDIPKSLTFLVTARQLPVKLPNDGRSRLQVVQAFGALLTVAPLKGASDLRLVGSQPARAAGGRPAVAVTVENPGNAHALIANATLRVGGQTLSPENMRSLVGIGIVEPGTRRRFIVPLDAPASDAVTIDYRRPL